MVSRLRFTRGTYPFQRHQPDQCGRDKSHSPHARSRVSESIASHLAWSPDGSKIAFYQPSNPPDSNQEVINLIDLSSGAIETLTRPGFYNARELVS